MIQDVEARIRKHIQKISPDINVDDVNTNDNLADLGINSIGFIKIIVALEQEFDLEFEDEDLDVNRFPNLNALAEYIDSLI